MTASDTGSPRYSSATRFISRRMIPEISEHENVLPDTTMRASLFGPSTIS